MKRLKLPNYGVEPFCYFYILLVVVLITPSNQHEQRSLEVNNQQQPRSASSAEYQNELTSTPPAMSVPYFRASIPMRIYECLRDFSTLRCTKLFVLEKMEGQKTEERKQWPNTGNITKDFLNQFFGEEEQMGSLISDRFRKMSDKDLNKRLVLNFQRFFKNRDIKLRFLPGLMVKIVPSKENKLKFSLKKKSKYHHQGRSQDNTLKSILKDSGLGDSSVEGHENTSVDEDEIDGKMKQKGPKNKRKHKKDKVSYKHTMLQMAVPVMIMPAILMGTFLPFILPVLKMATLTTMIMNNTAFVAALIYAARQHVNAQEEQPINYSYGGHTGFH